MRNNLDIPLFPNSKNDTHCVQAVLQMILRYYFPDREYPFTYLDRATYHYKGGWTWDTGVFIFLLNLGFEVVVIDEFDFKAFSERGIAYLRSIWELEEFETQALNARLEFEWRLVRDFVTSKKNISIQTRRGSKKDITDLFRKGYLVVPNVNAYSLDGERGTCGHYVLITGVDKKIPTFNDPGLPAIKNREVTWYKFEKARKENPSLFAVKIPERQ